MQVNIYATRSEAAASGARIVAEVVSRRASPVLGLATGSSPMGIYAELADMVARGEIDFSDATAFALDEYVGLPAQREQSYAAVIDRAVTRPLRMDPRRVNVPDGLAPDLDAMCALYEDAISRTGGIDIQILGIGSNGHIGFNEPTSSFRSRTRVAVLAQSTRRDNARFFADLDEVPTRCVTQGLGTIMEARKLVLIAHGAEKAEAIERAIEGPQSMMCPASILQTHPDVTLLLDEPAARRLRFGEYYNYVGTSPAQVGLVRTKNLALR